MPFVADPERTVAMQCYDAVFAALKSIRKAAGYAFDIRQVMEVKSGPLDQGLFPLIAARVLNDRPQTPAQLTDDSLDQNELLIALEGWLQSNREEELRADCQRLHADILTALAKSADLNGGLAMRTRYLGAAFFLSDAADNEGGVIVQIAVQYRHMTGDPYGQL